MQIFSSITRGCQLLFSVVVVGISANLAKGQLHGSVPSQTGYAIFTGALGILAALIGIVALFIDSLDGIITWVLDGVTSLALLAGGIVIAIAIKGTDCNSKYDLFHNNLLNTGCSKAELGKDNWTICGTDESHMHSRCISARADSAFMFLAFLACLAAIVASFLSGRHRR
ncbi:hypothetical protein N7492_002546 [Penicillium capsulatum]|uniref:MARVEL domain-containing protein n=1 Tax=Penicillium capsulatum TaxID=69766 RepID=A0A9W9LVA7_9EURO|nr:hypothetical protein N7492_002546 [Penicillium capsulatum]KAJ6122850.1 hypothetical protein N7512_005315 [Penicillium capsulatum]